MVSNDPGEGKPSPHDEDQRIQVFTDFVFACDRFDTHGALAAIRRLRQLGVSVVLLPPRKGAP